MTVMSLENQTVSFAACLLPSCGGGTAAALALTPSIYASLTIAWSWSATKWVTGTETHMSAQESAQHQRRPKGFTVRFDPNEAGFDFAIVMRKIRTSPAFAQSEPHIRRQIHTVWYRDETCPQVVHD
jgi:hypothetical protein